MTWTRLSDTFTDAPAMLALGRSARLLHVEALVWCNKHLTDGAVPRGALPRLTDSTQPEADVAELVATGLWSEDATGWRIDWADQEAADVVRARLAKGAAKSRRSRKHRDGDHSECLPSYCRFVSAGHVPGHAPGHDTGVVTPIQTKPILSDPKGGKEKVNGATAPTSAGAPVAAPRPTRTLFSIDLPHVPEDLT